jgi:tight adherence protein C
VRSPTAPTAFFGTKSALALGLPLLGVAVLSLGGVTLKGQNLLLALLALTALGYYLPNVLLGQAVMRRQRDIFESFPDALDMMTVCVEAGLGTEAAMVRVADDLQIKSPTLAEELRLVNLELRAGADRERALRNLALRTGVEEVDGFVSMINQAERFGTSIAASLRVHADMLRTVRRQRAEEAAAKIGLKLLFPLIFCIFPSLMVVLMGPAMIQIYRVLLPSMGAR